MLSVTATDLPRVMQCNGSLTMPAHDYRGEIDTTVRDEGNAAHWLVEKCFRRADSAAAYANMKAANGIFITPDMAEHVQDYIDNLWRGGQFDNVEVETLIAGGAFEVKCRADHICYKDNILYIDDFKYGFKLIDVKDNWTLIAHAIGFCLTYDIRPEIITMVIHQPRARHPDGTRREWSVDYDTLAQKYYSQIVATLSNPTNMLNTGGNCRRCPSMTVCPAATAAGFSAVEESSLAFSQEISNDELSAELDLLKAAETRLIDRRKALEELAIYRLRTGQLVKGYAVEQGKGNTTWRKGITPEMLLAFFGKDLTKGKLITPTQAKRVIANDELFDALAATLTTRPETGVKLKRTDANTQAASLLT